MSHQQDNTCNTRRKCNIKHIIIFYVVYCKIEKNEMGLACGAYG